MPSGRFLLCYFAFIFIGFPTACRHSLIHLREKEEKAPSFSRKKSRKRRTIRGFGRRGRRFRISEFAFFSVSPW
jgi:hypothetical protein